MDRPKLSRFSRTGSLLQLALHTPSRMSSLCGFNSTAAAFVALSSIADNRLSVYDVANGAQLSQLVPEGHLNKLNACTALALGQLVNLFFFLFSITSSCIVVLC
jgi:hypothetical protein